MAAWMFARGRSGCITRVAGRCAMANLGVAICGVVRVVAYGNAALQSACSTAANDGVVWIDRLFVGEEGNRLEQDARARACAGLGWTVELFVVPGARASRRALVLATETLAE